MTSSSCRAPFGREPRAGDNAIPGRGTKVPLYILGSSLFGAQLAARFGLPYAFASHFAPDALQQAVDVYRREFRASDQLAEPYVIAALNVVVADAQDDAEALAAWCFARGCVRSPPVSRRMPASSTTLPSTPSWSRQWAPRRGT